MARYATFSERLAQIENQLNTVKALLEQIQKDVSGLKGDYKPKDKNEKDPWGGCDPIDYE